MWQDIVFQCTQKATQRNLKLSLKLCLEWEESLVIGVINPLRCHQLRCSTHCWCQYCGMPPDMGIIYSTCVWNIHFNYFWEFCKWCLKRLKKKNSQILWSGELFYFRNTQNTLSVIDKTDACNWNNRVQSKATVWWRPFIFWRTREGFLLPLELYPFIRLRCGRFNTSLPSSIPVERLFSFTEIIFYLRRSWLTPETFENFKATKQGADWSGWV